MAQRLASVQGNEHRHVNDLATAHWRTLKDSQDRWVAVSTPAGADPATPIVLKVAHLRGVLARVRAVLGLTPLGREFLGAERAAGLGFPASTPFAMGRCQLDGRPAAFLVSRYIAGHTLLEHLADAKPKGNLPGRAVCAQLGSTIAGMVRKGWFNRDFKPSNIVVAEGARGERVELTQIDCAGIRRCDARRLDHAPIEMLSCLMLEPMGCGVAPSARLQARVVRDLIRAWNDDGSDEPLDREVHKAGVRVVMRLVRDRIARHGDPTPRDWPLPGRPGGAS